MNPSSQSVISLVAALLVTLLSVGGCFARSTPTSLPRPADSVNVGYGAQARRDVTGAIASLEGDVARRSTPTSMADLLTGRFAGVDVQRLAGGCISVRIRGQRSNDGNSEPLYVVDGVPLSSGVCGKLADLNAAEVQRIDVLKDASATAVYGSRGANGVILITMRRPQ